MNARLMRWTMLVGLFSLGTVGSAGAAAKTSAVWKTYRSPDYGFKIDYPESMNFYSGHPVRPPEISMFPICDGTTIACFQYNGDALKETTTQAVGISVNVLRDARSESECNSIDTGSSPIKTAKIHGAKFHFGDESEAGLGSSRSMTEYRTLYQHVCFEVAVVTAASNIAPEEMKEEGFRYIDRRTWHRVWHDLDRMLHSFTFVGPVRDGPDWEVYSNNGCGGAFEHPSSSTVEKLVEYSNEAFNSSRITCKEVFTHKGREYTVAVKVNLKDDDALDEWLSSSGYPGLEQIKPIAKYDQATEYSDQTYTYFRIGNDVFIFTVSGTDHRPIPFDGDAVFAHLLESFEI